MNMKINFAELSILLVEENMLRSGLAKMMKMSEDGGITDLRLSFQDINKLLQPHLNRDIRTMLLSVSQDEAGCADDLNYLAFLIRH
jgi:hypothetical protein